jgi:hypothetical protein
LPSSRKKPTRRIELAARVLIAASVAAAGVTDCRAATRYDWRLRFGTIRTTHFDIHAHRGEEALAWRLASIVEDVRGALQQTLGLPRGRVQVILVDQTDLSNGWANPFPYDAIEITAAPPASETSIGNTDDWLRVAFTHEYTHILHLDRTRGWMEGVRRVFGRAPFAFPNLFLPEWQIEGLATFEESQVTHQGRVPAGDFRVIVDTAAHAHRFQPYDRVSGGLVAWPSDLGAYAYGAYFHRFLADRYGTESLNELADASSGRAPFFGAPAFTGVFGRSIGTLWNDYRTARQETAVPASATDGTARQLTHEGFNLAAPRYGSDGTVYYATNDPHRFPALERLPPDGRPQTLTTRVLGERTSVRGDWIVFDQLGTVRSTAFYSDLYAVKTEGGRTRRLTVEARASDADLSPDGRRIVCILQKVGYRAVAVLDFRPDRRTTPTAIVDQPDGDFTGPRWSPDGRQVVVSRRQRGRYDLVVIDVATHKMRSLVGRADVRLITPSWTPDGRTILFAANVGDEPFNVFAVSVDDGRVRRVTDSVSGATAPDVSPDGRRLLYLGYTLGGYDLFDIPYEPDAWQPIEWPMTFEPSARPAPGSASLGSYRPWRSLVPTYWTPVVASDAGELLIGAGTAMSDVLGRHAYAADAAWSGARGVPDWHASYAYDRWWPAMFAAYSDDTNPTSLGDSRTRQLLTGALLPIRHVRWAETGLAALNFEDDALRCDTFCSQVRVHRQLGSIRAGWIHDSRRQFGYSISAEEGVEVEGAVDVAIGTLGSDADSTSVVLDVRGFQRVLGRHTVLAGRIAFAGASGPPQGRRLFSAAGPGPSVAAFDFGRDTIGLLRGVAADDLLGSRAAVANVDLRFPLAYPERGFGSWPVLLRSLHSAVFVDAGQAWNRTIRLGDFRTSVGGEISLDVVLGHYLPLTFAGGAAWTHDPVAAQSALGVFGRIGRAF